MEGEAGKGERKGEGYGQGQWGRTGEGRVSAGSSRDVRAAACVAEQASGGKL